MTDDPDPDPLQPYLDVIDAQVLELARAAGVPETLIARTGDGNE